MNKPAPFTENQKTFYDRCFASWFNAAEGGKRGGKNVLTTLAHCVKIETHSNKLHLAAGVSIASAKLNILDCDGFGMLNYFEGRCREGKYKNRDCLYVKTATGEKIILVSGGGKDGDAKYIKGNTYGTVYITEANECHPAFIQETFDRTLSSADRWIAHDFNPKDPGHWYYKEVLAFHEAQQKDNPLYGYNYGHFTIADNMSISDEKLRREMNTYDKGSIWYRRDILGERIAAEGIIYTLFANNMDAFIIDTAPKVAFSIIGVDFGGNKSGHAFNCTGYEPSLAGVVTLADYWSNEKMDASALANEFVSFVKECVAEKGNVVAIYADSAEQVLIRTIRKALVKAGIGIPVYNAKKGRIFDRIGFYCMLMKAGKYKLLRRCNHTLKAFASAAWNPKRPDERLDDGSTNIDNLDAQEYSTEPYQKQIIDILMLGGQNGG